MFDLPQELIDFILPKSHKKSRQIAGFPIYIVELSFQCFRTADNFEDLVGDRRLTCFVVC